MINKSKKDLETGSRSPSVTNPCINFVDALAYNEEKTASELWNEQYHHIHTTLKDLEKLLIETELKYRANEIKDENRIVQKAGEKLFALRIPIQGVVKTTEQIFYEVKFAREKLESPINPDEYGFSIAEIYWLLLFSKKHLQIEKETFARLTDIGSKYQYFMKDQKVQNLMVRKKKFNLFLKEYLKKNNKTDFIPYLKQTPYLSWVGVELKE
jgi:hypothetical protein